MQIINSKHIYFKFSYSLELNVFKTRKDKGCSSYNLLSKNVVIEIIFNKVYDEKNYWVKKNFPE